MLKGKNGKLHESEVIWTRNAATTNTIVSCIERIKELSLEVKNSSSNLLMEEDTEFQYSSLPFILS